MKKLDRAFCIILFLSLLVTACNPDTLAPSTMAPPPTPTHLPTPTIEIPATRSPDVKQYLSDAIDIIEKNALNSKNVDCEKVRATALDLEKDGKTPADTYDTITYVLKK